MENILIITYYWPPAGGPGVQRWLKFSKYLPEFGFTPHVYVPENPSYPLQDESLQREVSSSIKVIKRPIFEPASFSKILAKDETKSLSAGIIPDDSRQSKVEQMMLYVRGNYFIPDARKFWINPSIKFLSQYIEQKGIKKIITTGPPHSLHLIGLGLKEKFPALYWLADFRDPWTSIGYHSKLKLSDVAQQKHIDLEKKVLVGADQIVVTSFQTKEEFSKITSVPIEVITNGFDTRPELDIELDESFSLSHIGSLLSERNPLVLWEVIAECVEENEHFRHFFELNLIGKVSENVIESIESFGLKEYVKVLGYVSHEEALKLQEQSQLLLLIEINKEETRGIIPGKFFEYLSAKRPILAIGPASWDVAKLIQETASGASFTYEDKHELKNYLITNFEAFLKGKLFIEPKNIQKYSRHKLTQQLAQLLQP